MRRLGAVVLLLAACRASSAGVDTGPVGRADAGGDEDARVAAEAGVTGCEASTKALVAVPTDDGLTLAADLWTNGQAGGPAVILLHMNPSGGNDRTNFPDAFIEKLVARGLTVLNLDRRGVGTNDAALKQSAYLGPDGKLDAKAGFTFLLAHPCRPDDARLGVIGASNGTTTALDFTVFAAGDAATPRPKALVFLTGGTYTENQYSMAAQRPLLDPLPLLFAYQTAEAAWSEQFQNLNAGWSFLPVAAGHGTQMLQQSPTSMDAVSTWIADHL